MSKQPMTSLPCPGCGKAGKTIPGGKRPLPFRGVGEVCRQCQQLIAEAKAARQRVKQADGTELLSGHDLNVPHWWPFHFGFGRADPKPCCDELRSALVGVIASVATPTPEYANLAECSFAHEGTRYDGVLAFRVPAGFRAAVQRLYYAITDVVEKAEIDGRRQGRDILRALASGEVSIAELNKLSAEEDADE